MSEEHEENRPIGSLIRWTVIVLAILALAWAALTCATSGTGETANLDQVLRDAAIHSIAPAPTPVPASPLGVHTRLPAAGEPPTAVFSEDEEAYMDELPADGDDAQSADASPTPASPSAT